jgi:hypothetical protein
MRLLVMLALVAFHAGCQREPPYMSFCDAGGGNCREFRTEEQLNRYWQHDLTRRRNLANGLSVDFREIAFVLVRDFLRNRPPFPSNDARYYLSILQEDPERALIDRLAASGIRVEPASSYRSVTVDGQDIHRVGDRAAVSVGVGEIRWVKAGIYRARYGYHCGSLCAGGYEALLQCAHNRCELLKADLLWIS